jgi:hypothetical protein
MGSRTLILTLLGLTTAAGCASGRVSGSLRAESLGDDRVYLDGVYETAVYTDLNTTETSFFITDIPMDELLAGDITTGMVIHFGLLWEPSAGKTPMDTSATNVTVRYIVFTDGEMGIYGGAGFAIPKGEPGKGPMSLVLRDASMTLLDSTDGFIDLLSPGRLTGTITAGLDKQRSQQMAYALNQLVTNALGYTRLVAMTRPSPTLERRPWS